MGWSSLASERIPVTNYSSRNGRGICKITPHHMAGNLSLERCAEVLQDRNCSANYGIDSYGNIACFVDEDDRSWASCSYDNDSQAITIECANDEYGGDWHISDACFESLINLCVDICQRYGFRLEYDGTPEGSLTRHNMFYETACPGPYLQSRFDDLAYYVNQRLGGGGDTPEVGTIMKVNSDDGLYLLDDDGNKLDAYENGTKVEFLGDGYNKYGYHYYRVKVLYNDAVGYMASAYLEIDNPEPQPEPTPSPSDEFHIGERVLVTGYATEDSYGGGEQTADYTGNPNDPDDIRFITAINPDAPRPYHISVGNTLGDGDRGWVAANQLQKI